MISLQKNIVVFFNLRDVFFCYFIFEYEILPYDLLSKNNQITKW